MGKKRVDLFLVLLPYGLFDLLIKADAVGGTAKVTFYLEAPAGDNDEWYKYKASTGTWYRREIV